MQPKYDTDTTTGTKLLRLFQKLMLDGRKHFQADLAQWLNCSPPTIMRLIAEIEGVVGTSLESGIECRKRWYQIRSIPRSRLGLEFEEVRFLSICRDLAEPYLAENIKQRVDDTIFNLSMLLSDQGFANRQYVQKNQFGFSSKGRIDYTPYYEHINKLLNAAEKNCICLMRYKPAGSNTIKEYRFAVGRIISMNNALYALGATVSDDLKTLQRLTSFAVHRIKNVQLTDAAVHFAIPDVNLKTFGLPWHEPRIFRIHFAAGKVADYVRERIWADNQHFEEQADGSVILEFTSHSEPEVLSWVRSFGDKAKLICKN